MAPEGAQRVQAVARDGVERRSHHLLHAPARAVGGEGSYHAGYCFGLARFCELFEVGEVHALAAELYGVEAPAAGGLPLAATEVYGGGAYASALRRADFARRAGRRPRWEAFADLAGAGGGVAGLVVFQQQHAIRNVQVVPDPADDHHGRDAEEVVEGTDEGYEGRNRLLANQLAHPLVPDHE